MKTHKERDKFTQYIRERARLKNIVRTLVTVERQHERDKALEALKKLERQWTNQVTF